MFFASCRSETKFSVTLMTNEVRINIDNGSDANDEGDDGDDCEDDDNDGGGDHHDYGLEDGSDGANDGEMVMGM